LNGTWLGEPLHVVLTDVPVGAWTVAMAFDLLDVGFVLRRPVTQVAGFPLAPFLEQGDALEALQSVTFRAQCAGGAQAAMLCHKSISPFHRPNCSSGAGACNTWPVSAPEVIWALEDCGDSDPHCATTRKKHAAGLTGTWNSMKPLSGVLFVAAGIQLLKSVVFCSAYTRPGSARETHDVGRAVFARDQGRGRARPFVSADVAPRTIRASVDALVCGWRRGTIRIVQGGLPTRKAIVGVGPPLSNSGKSNGSVLFRLVPEVHAGVASEERLWPRSVMTPKQLLLKPLAIMLFTIWKTPPVFAMEPP